MNTGENVIFSLPVIEAALGLQNIRSVICLGNTWTARRYPMTLHRHWPEVEKMLVTVDSFETPRALWHTDSRNSAAACSANGTRSSRTRRRASSRSGRRVQGAIDNSIRSKSKSSSSQSASPPAVRRAGSSWSMVARREPAGRHWARGRALPRRSSRASRRCRAARPPRRRFANANAAAASATDDRIWDWPGSRNRQDIWPPSAGAAPRRSASGVKARRRCRRPSGVAPQQRQIPRRSIRPIEPRP